MNEEITTFDDIEIKNINFTISINNADIDKIIPNKVSRSKKGFKYFIGYKEDGKVEPVCFFASKNEWINKKF